MAVYLRIVLADRARLAVQPIAQRGVTPLGLLVAMIWNLEFFTESFEERLDGIHMYVHDWECSWLRVNLVG